MKKFSIEVTVEGQALKAISDGTEEGTVFTGPDGIIRLVKKAIDFCREVPIIDDRTVIVVKAGYENPVALTAALFSVLPLYTHIQQAPQEVYDFFGQKNVNDTGAIAEELNN